MAEAVNEHNGGVGPQGVKALEVLLADIENRLRGTILRIIRPSLQQASDMSARLEVVAVKVEQHENILHTTEKVEQDLKKQAEVTAVLKEQLDARDDQASLFEKQTLGLIAHLQNQNADVEAKLEEHSGELSRGQRESSRIWDDVERMQREHNETVKGIWKGVADGSKKSDRIRDEAAAGLAELQKQLNNLTEELFGEHKGLTKIREDLGQLTQFVDCLPQVEREVNHVAEIQEKLEKRQDECEHFCNNAQDSYQAFTLNCDKRLTDTNEEFKEGVNQLIAHHASLMQGMRRDYSSELQASAQMREDVKNFESMLRKYCKDIGDDVVAESRRLDSVHKQLNQEFEDMKSRRKKEKQAHIAEVQDLKRDMQIQQEVVGGFHGSLGYISRIVGLVLEGEKVTSALHLQDYADRLGERWLGRPEDQVHRVQLPHTAEMLEKMPRRFPGDIDCISGNPSMQQLVPVDTKKGLAKMGYMPGRVSYGGLHYDRQDMLLLHNKLLQKAFYAFEKGPPNQAANVIRPLKELACSMGQPSAVGGAGGSHGSIAHVPKKIFGFGDGWGTGDFSEDPKSTAASTAPPGTGTRYQVSRETLCEMRPLSKEGTGLSGKRPGSQGHRPGSTGQPQGTGSRGTMFGALGETEPPADADRLDPLGQSEGRGGNGRRSMGQGTVRLPVIESMGCSTAREHHSSEAIESGSLRSYTAR